MNDMTIDERILRSFHKLSSKSYLKRNNTLWIVMKNDTKTFDFSLMKLWCRGCLLTWTSNANWFHFHTMNDWNFWIDVIQRNRKRKRGRKLISVWDIHSCVAVICGITGITSLSPFYFYSFLLSNTKYSPNSWLTWSNKNSIFFIIISLFFFFLNIGVELTFFDIAVNNATNDNFISSFKFSPLACIQHIHNHAFLF